MLEQPLVFTGCSSIQIFNSPPSTNTVSEADWGNLPLTEQQLCGFQDAISLHWLPIASRPSAYLEK